MTKVKGHGRGKNEAADINQINNLEERREEGKGGKRAFGNTENAQSRQFEQIGKKSARKKPSNHQSISSTKRRKNRKGPRDRHREPGHSQNKEGEEKRGSGGQGRTGAYRRGGEVGGGVWRERRSIRNPLTGEKKK